MNPKKTPSLGFYVLGYMVLSASIVGYFVGLQSPIRQTQLRAPSTPDEVRAENNDPTILLATSYTDIGNALRSHKASNRTAMISTPEYDPGEESTRSVAAEKQFALRKREQNRAFNGAPPTIPHPIEQMSAASCIACHSEGLKTASLRASRMSHPYYANCTQCHVESNPGHMPPVTFQSNLFEGLPAPASGPRAFANAPPQVPHSTWMRSECLSCHGASGSRGLRTTHPWRQNCQQCHTPSSELEQIQLPAQSAFLPAPNITE